MLMNIWLVILYTTPTAQLSMLLATNIAYVFYILYFRPYVNVINTVVTPLAVLTLILIEGYMLYFFINDKNMFAD